MKCFENKYRRQQLLNDPGVPTQSEIRKNLGSPLAEIFFNSLDDTCQHLLGMVPPIKPPANGDLWMSPSDILVGKVMFTPPMPTRRVTRALTHKGVLDIGSQCLYKLENEARLDKERCLEELEANMRLAAALELERAVQATRDEEREIHEREIQAMIDSFREELEQAVDETQTRLLKVMASRVQEERREIHELMQDQKAAAVQDAKEVMTDAFQRKLQETIDGLNNYYHEYIHMMADQFQWCLRLEAYNNSQYITQLRFNLEAQYDIDVAYAVCRERQRCEADKERIIQEYTEQIAELHKVILSKIALIEEEQQATQRAIVRCTAWENRIREIVREFQKFINFTLKAVPGQAEFLLSLEKLLIIEMQKPEVIEPASEPLLEPTPESAEEPHETPAEETEEKLEIEELLRVDITESNEEDLLVPFMQMGTEAEDVQSEGEEIASHLLGDLISETTSMADSIAAQLVQRIVRKAVPPNTEEEEVIGDILEKLIVRSTPLGEEVVESIIELLLKSSTPMPEAEKAVETILREMIEKAMGPETFDVATQAPPVNDPQVTICEATEVHFLLEGLAKKAAEAQQTTPDASPATDVVMIDTLTSTAVPNNQECAWCEIKETQSITVLPPEPQDVETKTAVEEVGASTDSQTVEPQDEHPEEQTFQERGYVGEGGTEHQQRPEEFLAERVQSLLKIFRKHPSVAQIFVPHCGI